jgi:hypothetical protein
MMKGPLRAFVCHAGLLALLLTAGGALASQSSDLVPALAAAQVESSQEPEIQLALTLCCEGPYTVDEERVVCVKWDQKDPTKCLERRKMKIKVDKCRKRNPPPCAS